MLNVTWQINDFGLHFHCGNIGSTKQRFCFCINDPTMIYDETSVAGFNNRFLRLKLVPLIDFVFQLGYTPADDKSFHVPERMMILPLAR